MTDDYIIHLLCPYCHHGEILATNRAKVTISSVCPVCGNRFFSNLELLQTYRKQDLFDHNPQIGPFLYRIPCPCPQCTGETWADGTATVFISIRCGKRKCHQYYTADLVTMTSFPSSAVRKPIRRKCK